MEKLTKLVERLKKIGITVTFVGNYPWIYVQTINDIYVTQELSKSTWICNWFPNSRWRL